MFVVTGITGQTGSAAALALLRAGQRVRAIVRDKARAALWTARGVELVEADAADTNSLAGAFQGAEGAYMLVPPDLTHPEPLAHYEAVARAIGEAASRVRLPRLVFLSSEGAHLASGTGPIVGAHRAEGILAGVAPRTTFLRPSFFQENWRAVFDLAGREGIMPTMLSDLDATRPMVATADIGRVAAELLMAERPPSLVELGGPVPSSARDAAAAMSAALGRGVVPVQPPREAWVGILTGAGLREPYAHLIVEMYEGINTGHVRFSGEGRQERGRIALAETIGGWTRAAAA
jgi:uncharacterized protein YbjT (DUF2867 family)